MGTFSSKPIHNRNVLNIDLPSRGEVKVTIENEYLAADKNQYITIKFYSQLFDNNNNSGNTYDPYYTLNCRNNTDDVLKVLTTSTKILKTDNDHIYNPDADEIEIPLANENGSCCDPLNTVIFDIDSINIRNYTIVLESGDIEHGVNIDFYQWNNIESNIKLYRIVPPTTSHDEIELFFKQRDYAVVRDKPRLDCTLTI